MEYEMTTDLFQHRYYRLNVMFMKLTGQWPYHSANFRYVIIAIVLCFGVTHMIPQIMAVVKHYNDWDFLMQCAYSLLFSAFCITKIINSVFNSHKMLMVLNQMHTNWKIWDHNRDVEVLHEYARRGRSLTIVAIVLCFVSCNIFIMQPVIPKIADVLLSNGTAPGQFPIPVDYYTIDMQKYYFYIILHGYLIASLAFIFSMSYDCMFYISVQHCCGLFVALGHQLQRIGKNKKSTETRKIVDSLEQRDVDMTHLRWCVDRHCDAIQFAELIEEYNSWCFFFIVGINIVLISMIGLEIVKKTVDRQQSIRFAVMHLLAITHLYMENYMAQILIDCSISIRYYIFESEWYKLSTNAKKILLFMTMRCNVPCTLTAGKIAILSIETFATMLKTSLSYFTLLRSV